jgi:predicted enzyme related to lactoylglutathione lyase
MNNIVEIALFTDDEESATSFHRSVFSACHEPRAQGVAFLVEPRDYPWGRLVELAQASS